MNYLQVKDWDEHQSYRKDRGTPPWIKIHRRLMTSAKWAALTDSEKGQLVSLWIAAADKDGRIPADPLVLRKICMLDETPNINKFIDLGFLLLECQPSDNQVTTNRQPNDAPETETEAETDKTNGSPAKPPNRIEDDFEKLWKKYPKRNGSNPKKKALQSYRTRIKEHTKPEDIQAGLERYGAWCKATGKIGTETVMQASRFFGPGIEWENEWEIAPQAAPENIQSVPADSLESWSLARDGPAANPGESTEQYRNRILLHLKGNRNETGTIEHTAKTLCS